VLNIQDVRHVWKEKVGANRNVDLQNVEEHHREVFVSP
jgi:hypothetical protein